MTTGARAAEPRRGGGWGCVNGWVGAGEHDPRWHAPGGPRLQPLVKIMPIIIIVVVVSAPVGLEPEVKTHVLTLGSLRHPPTGGWRNME